MQEAILLTRGSKAIVASIVNSVPVSFSKFRIGSTVGYTPELTAKDVQGFVYEGKRNAIRWYLADNPEIMVLELTMNSSVGDFDIGNIMVFDQYGDPFAAAVRNTPIPKLKNLDNQIGSEIIVSLAVRILSNEKSSSVTVYTEEQAVLPVVDTEDGLVSGQAVNANYPVYLVSNFDETNAPALLYADAQQNIWWVNTLFTQYEEGGFLTISGGFVGDKYVRQEGKLISGGKFNDYSDADNISSNTFGDDATTNETGGQFGD